MKILQIAQKYIIILAISFIFGVFFIKMPFLVLSIQFAIIVFFFLSKGQGFFFTNIIFLTIILGIFSGDAYMLNLAHKINIYELFAIWKFNIFEWWILSIFFIFIIFHMSTSSKIRVNLFTVKPLKPLLWFTLGGLTLGILQNVRSIGDLHFYQLRFYLEGILLCLIILNIDFRKINVSNYFYFIISIVTIKALYHLVLYLLGHGFKFGHVGYIVIGYGDILEIIVLISLLIFSALIYVKNIDRFKYLTGILFFVINTLVLFLSLRRGYIGMFIIGLFLIILFSSMSVKFKSIFIVFLLLCSIVALSFLSTNQANLNKIFKRIDSINIFKYKDDSGKKITSSSGHISEVVNSWMNVRENMLLGKGFMVEIEKRTGWQAVFQMVHNELFFYWIRMGIFGMLMFFAMYLIPIIYCFKRIKNPALYEYRWFYLAMMGFILGKFVLGATFYPPISITMTDSFIYFIILGFLLNETLFKKIYVIKPNTTKYIQRMEST